MLLTALQVAGMVGPDRPACACENCELLRRVKAVVCEPVTRFDAELNAGADVPDGYQAAWVAVFMIAISRLRAQGWPPDRLFDAMSHAAEMAEELNPLLCEDDNEGPWQ
jgi:hypothetical protein